MCAAVKLEKYLILATGVLFYEKRLKVTLGGVGLSFSLSRLYQSKL